MLETSGNKIACGLIQNIADLEFSSNHKMINGDCATTMHREIECGQPKATEREVADLTGPITKQNPI
jgi:hypothetical protein